MGVARVHDEFNPIWLKKGECIPAPIAEATITWSAGIFFACVNSAIFCPKQLPQRSHSLRGWELRSTLRARFYVLVLIDLFASVGQLHAG